MPKKKIDKSSMVAKVISGAIAKKFLEPERKSNAKGVDLVGLAEKLTKRHLEAQEQEKD